MQIDSPTWYLNQDCPCCNQGTLAFQTCPTCQLVVLTCGELGLIFEISDQRCGAELGQFGTGGVCPKCGVSTYSSFRNSSSGEIRALGFRWPQDYQ
jgi:Zn-finger nucleic acid-binding protein